MNTLSSRFEVKIVERFQTLKTVIGNPKTRFNNSSASIMKIII